MTVRDELERVISAPDIGNLRAAARHDLEYVFSIYRRFLRDHGPALLEALDGWQRMTEEARLIQRRHLGKHEGDVYHAMQFLCVKFGARSSEPVFRKHDTARRSGG